MNESADITDLFYLMVEPKQVLPFWVRVDLEVMAIKGYFALPRSSELQPHYKAQFSVIPRTLLLGVPHSFGLVPHLSKTLSKLLLLGVGDSYPSAEDTVSVFYASSLKINFERIS